MARKLIMRAFYINISGLTRQQAELQLNDLMANNSMENLPEDMQNEYYFIDIWLPIMEGQSKVDVLYPGPFQLGEYITKVSDIDNIIESLQLYKESLKDK